MGANWWYMAYVRRCMDGIIKEREETAATRMRELFYNICVADITIESRQLKTRNWRMKITQENKFGWLFSGMAEHSQPKALLTGKKFKQNWEIFSRISKCLDSAVFKFQNKRNYFDIIKQCHQKCNSSN